MKTAGFFLFTIGAPVISVLFLAPGLEPFRSEAHPSAMPAASIPGELKGTWYFAVSGDSRDCGDLIVPKIARAIEANHGSTPVEFYWHLGDYRAFYRIDCDIAKRAHPSFQCDPDKRTPDEINPREKKEYEATAWDDFIQRQIAPFGHLPVILGVGNHELMEHTRDEFRSKFREWLTQPLLRQQASADERDRIPSKSGETYYHFIKGGVDFIYLDNAGKDVAFGARQIQWLSQVLAADAKRDEVKTMIVGMHAALPFSISRNHAMDATCAGVCSGQQVYNLLFEAQNSAGPPARRKHVYVLASHSHYFEQNIYDTPEHLGRVLPGLIIGTAGAEQYRETIRYGYMLMGIRADGTVDAEFKEVKREDPPAATGPGAAEITAFCYEQNKKPPQDTHKTDCRCGMTK